MNLPLPSRRAALALGAGVLAMSAAPRLAVTPAKAMDLATLSPLGFQAHSIRIPLARDFPGTLRVMRAMGYEAVELAYFPGFAGNVRGGFTPLEDLRPDQIRRTISDADLICSSAHFLDDALQPDQFARSADWARGVGLTYMVHGGLALPARPSMDDLRRELDKLNETGVRVRAAGMRLGLHTSHHVWRTLDGQPAVEEMMRRLDPANCDIQIDFGSIVQAGVDGAAILDRYPGRFFSLHLRDAKTPEDSYAYLPAAPLGTGEVDWVAVLRAARRAGVKQYVVEMTQAPGGVLDAKKESYDFLANLEI